MSSGISSSTGKGTEAPIPFEQVVPGLRVDDWQVEVKPRTVARLDEAVGDPSSDRVTPMLGGNLCVGIAFRILPRNILHTYSSIRIHGEAAVGDMLTVRAQVVEVTARRERAYVSLETEVLGPSGSPVWSGASEFMVAHAPTAGLPEGSGTRLELPEGFEEIGRHEASLELPEMIAFSGRGNFHSDSDIARRFGYRAAVAQGMHLAALGLKVAAQHVPAGGGWPSRGSCELRFIGLAFEKDLIQSIIGRASGDDRLWLRIRSATSDEDVVLGVCDGSGR
jgi:acyl dehydratase